MRQIVALKLVKSLCYMLTGMMLCLPVLAHANCLGSTMSHGATHQTKLIEANTLQHQHEGSSSNDLHPRHHMQNETQGLQVDFEQHASKPNGTSIEQNSNCAKDCINCGSCVSVINSDLSQSIEAKSPPLRSDYFVAPFIGRSAPPFRPPIS